MKECDKNIKSCVECSEAPCELTPPVIRPCPFCGGVARITVKKSLIATAECERCGVIMKRDFKENVDIYRKCDELMKQAWNARVN